MGLLAVAPDEIQLLLPLPPGDAVPGAWPCPMSTDRRPGACWSMERRPGGRPPDGLAGEGEPGCRREGKVIGPDEAWSPAIRVGPVGRGGFRVLGCWG